MINRAIKDVLVYGLSSILTRGMSFLLIPFYTHILSPADFGVFDLITTLGALANLVVALEVSQGLSRFWPEAQGAAHQRRLASTVFFFTVFMFGVFYIAGLTFSVPIGQMLFGVTSYESALRLGFAFMAINGVYYLLINQFRWELRSKEYAVVSIVFSATLLGFTALAALWFKTGIEGLIQAQILAVSVGVLLAFALLRQSFAWQFDFRVLKDLLRFSMPLVPAGLAVFVSLYINRFALSHYGTLVDVGLYGLASRLAGVASLLIVGVQAAITPLIYQHYRDDSTPSEIARLFSGFSVVALLGCLALALFSRQILFVFASSEYQQAAVLIAILAPALLLSQMYVFAPGMAILKKTSLQLLVTLFAALVSVIGNFLLVPSMGGMGAALATLISSAAFFGAWVLVSQRLYTVPFEWRPLSISVAVYAMLVQSGYWVDEATLPMWQILLVKSGLLLAFVCVQWRIGLININKLRQLVLTGKV